jgi:hypothetical protein
MGRVSSKRKLKQCDPFFKGKRENGKKAKAFDLAPTKSKRAKKRQRKQMSDDAVEQYVLRTSAVGDDVRDAATGTSRKKNKKGGQLQVGSIREGESMREFNKRISTEVKRVIYDESKKNKRSSEKRKAFLDKKKQKEKNKKMTDQERYEREFQATGSTKRDQFDGVENVRFGERVDAPPIMPKLTGIFKKRARELGDAKQRKAKTFSASLASVTGQTGGKKSKKQKV